MDNRYAAHEAFVAPAARAQNLWRIIVMIVAFEVVFLLAPAVYHAFLPTQGLRLQFEEGVTAFGTLSQFAFFGIALAGFLFLLRLIHGRGFLSLIGPSRRARQDLLRVMIAVSLWMGALELMPPWIDPAQLDSVRAFGPWLMLIPVTLAILLIQVGTEELVFRGYLQQQFACLSSSPWAWMVFPSVMFGGLHFWNGETFAEGTVWALWATVLGLACADLTARTGNIGAAVGLHLSNNAFAVLLYGVAGWSGSGVALLLFPYEDPAAYSDPGLAGLADPFVIYELIVLLLTTYIMWLAARIAVRR